MEVPTIHQKWVEETSDHTIEGFATKFLYTDPQIAYLDFKAAVEKSRLKAQSKTSNEALTGDEGDASISSIPLQKNRSARYQIRSTSKKTRGGDEAGGDEASDGESDSEVLEDEAGVQDEESHWNVIRELREAEKDTEPGFYPLFRALYHAIKSYQVFVDVNDDVEEARLDDLKHQLRIDMAHFEEGSTKMVVAEILMILVKRCVSDKFGRSKRTESFTLFVCGETILREAQRDQVAVRVVVGSKAAIGRAGVSGRKLDFRLIATIKTGQRFEPFTLSNDEHRGLGSSGLAADIQRKKNMRLNKSIVMNGKRLEGTWNIMCPFKDVMLCCETEEPPLRLPSNEFELGGFLLEDGMERLLAYRFRVLYLTHEDQAPLVAA
ncbi:hypothetical protein KI688_012433 [Linnemannia hyalina]|uniref:Uncharacterized protein n=1 Tax=Linnemannia hyalina TaxID=64524 RepID=A0A9P7XSF3_9FUNG|nr:hypothetical protein KI688_012433 [Linnemannia hyalina]